MTESQQIAAYIDKWRTENGLSQNDFVTKAGVAQNFLTNLRRGADVQLATLSRAAEAMDLSLLELLAAAGVGGTQPATTGATRPDILTLIASDTDLLPEARQHFANQYKLLVRLNPKAAAREYLDETSQIMRAVAHAPDEPISADQDEAAYEA